MEFYKKTSARILSISKKINLVSFLGGKCEHCGESRFYVLDFHHDLEKYEKSFNISKYRSYRISLLLEEIKKCKLLCSNCHRKHHASLLNLNEKRITTKRTLLRYMKQECCSKCGESDINSIVFHHKNDKLFNVAEWTKNKHIKDIEDLDDVIKNELDKCIILCSCCHLEEHHDKEFFEEHKDEILKCSENIRENSKPLDKEKVKEMFLGGMRQIDIANYFGCVKSTVCDILKLFGLTMKISKRIDDKSYILQLHNQNFSNIEIAEILGISNTRIYTMLKKLKLKPNIKPQRKNNESIIIKEQFLEDYEKYTTKELAKKYNLTIYTIYKHLKRHNLKPKGSYEKEN